MDRRSFLKTILTTSLSAPPLMGQKIGLLNHELYLISDSPQEHLPSLLDELSRLNILRGQRFAFSLAHPNKHAIELILKERGWKASSVATADLLIGYSSLRNRARPSFTLVQDGRIRDLRSERLFSLWRAMQARPETRDLTILRMTSSALASQKGERVAVRVGGQIMERLPLKRNARRIIPTGSGHVTIVIENGQVRVEESSCPHRICVASSPISFTGERIICAPNHFLVEVEGQRWVDAVIG